MKAKMADRYAEVFDYPTMTAIYEDMVTRGKADPAVMRRLAWGYVQMGDYKQAEATYARLTLTPPLTADDAWNYAEVLRAQGKYNDALTWYGKYKELSGGDARADIYLDHGDLFARMKRDSARFTIRSLPINSAEADLGPTVMDDLLVFASARGEGVGGEGRLQMG
jgi:tetratricopeptide (TPR) repeat protein